MAEADRYDEFPNVVKLDVPADSKEDGAAWIYVPSKDTIYIGPQGSETLDLIDLVKRYVGNKKDEKFRTGLLYKDGFADIFNVVDKHEEGQLLRALENYHSQFGTEEDKHHNLEDWDPHGGWGSPSEDPYGDDDFDENGDVKELKHTPTLGDDDTAFWNKWKDQGGDYSKMKPTPGIKPIDTWEPKDYVDWRDKKHWADRIGQGFGATREDYPHWRWSFGDANLVKGAPHDGLWLWPTEHGYPDHFAQTGSNGLGNAAQGRVYPHKGDRWEILTWPDRPRNISDTLIKNTIQEEAQQAVKNYLMETVGIPEDKIYFTIGHYGQMVSDYNSSSYPGYDWRDRVKQMYGPSSPNPYGTMGEDIDWDESMAKGTPIFSLPPTTPPAKKLIYDPVSEAWTYNPKDDPQEKLVPDHDVWESQGWMWEEVWDPDQKKFVVRKVAPQEETQEQKWIKATQKPQTDEMTPEEKYEKTVSDFENNRTESSLRTREEGGDMIVVDEEAYEKAYAELGENWHLAFLPKRGLNEFDPVNKVWADGTPMSSMEQSAWIKDKEPLVTPAKDWNSKQDAFLWIGYKTGGHGDKDEIYTANAHWKIINSLTGKGKLETISDFLFADFEVPMLWGWVIDHEGMEGLIVTFSTVIAPMHQDFGYIKQALKTITEHYKRPVQDYDIIETNIPILESYTPKFPEKETVGGPSERGPPDRAGDDDLKRTDLKPIPSGIGSAVLKRDEIGDITVTTYDMSHAGSPGMFETEIWGGELNGEQYFNYTKDEAIRTHDALVTEEKSWQQSTTQHPSLLGKVSHQLPFKAVNIQPPPGSDHENQEKPFIYYAPANTLFYTTQYCHHSHIIEAINHYLQSNGFLGDGNQFGNPGDWVSGDITEPDWEGRNWIKLIDGSYYNQDMIQFLQDHFGHDRELRDSDGDPIYPNQIVKVADGFAKREERLKEWRWSYDPLSDDIQVWEVQDGSPSHMEQTGMRGLYQDAQGRIYLLKDHVDVFFWKDRPMGMAQPEKGEAQEKGWERAWEWIDENHIQDMIGQEPMETKMAASSLVLPNLNWAWFVAYSPKFTLNSENLILTHDLNSLEIKINQYNLQSNQYIKAKVANWGSNILYDIFPGGKKTGIKAFENAVKNSWGVDTVYSYTKVVQEIDAGLTPKFLLPVSGCFGYINHQLILGSRHHMEIMYRLLENGWTWDDLLNAKQAWGWFHNYLPSSGGRSVNFSSDAGMMTVDKQEVLDAFKNLFGNSFKDSGGYGGKTEKTFGGNFKDKYGDPTSGVEGLTGYKTEYDNSVISPLPAPPEKSETPPPVETPTDPFTSFIPGGGKPPPKKQNMPAVQDPLVNQIAELEVKILQGTETPQEYTKYWDLKWELNNTASSARSAATVDMTEGSWNHGYPQELHTCFGWINGDLYLGTTHHALMIKELIQSGKFDWESLINAKQMWGWMNVEDYQNQYIGAIEFATDDAKQTNSAQPEVEESFKEAFPFVNKWRIENFGSTQGDYGQRARDYYLGPLEN